MKLRIRVLISSAERASGGIAQLVERLVRNKLRRTADCPVSLAKCLGSRNQRNTPKFALIQRNSIATLSKFAIKNPNECLQRFGWRYRIERIENEAQN